MQSLMNNPVTRSNAPCLIVGIGYTTGSVRDLAQRAADYTPPLGDNATADERRQFGQADRFADFIDSELTAFLESRYTLNRNETAVFGHSFGALFGLYSLLSHRCFRRHWLVSPSIWWHNRRILDFMPSENRLDGIDACLNIGALERSSGCKRREERDMAGQAEQMAAELDRRGTAVFLGISECRPRQCPVLLADRLRRIFEGSVATVGGIKYMTALFCIGKYSG